MTEPGFANSSSEAVSHAVELKDQTPIFGHGSHAQSDALRMEPKFQAHDASSEALTRERVVLDVCSHQSPSCVHRITGPCHINDH